MCLALPALVIEKLEDGQAWVEQQDRRRKVSIQLVPDVEIGEYVLLNLGMAAKKLTQEQAQEIQAIWDQIAASSQYWDQEMADE